MKATKHVVLTLAALSASITVALASPAMTVTPSTVSITYVKGTGPGAAQNVVVKAVTGSIYFTVDSSLPNWLMVTPVNGTPSSTSGTTVAFSASPFVANMGAGVYTATVPFHQGSPDNPVSVSVTLTVSNAAATIVPPANLSLSWTATPGAALPTASLLLESTGDPVTFSLTPTYTNPSSAWFTVSTPSHVAYSWGTTATFSFVQSAFDNATIGKSLTGSLTITPSSGAAAITVKITIAITGPAATVTSIKPPKLPVVGGSGTGTRTIAVTGTNFVDGMNVHLNSGSPIVNNCSTFAAAKVNALCIQSSTLLYVKLTEATDLKNPGTITVNVGAANGTVTATTNPIVYAVTDSASFIEPASGNPSVSPYEIVSIFGDNLASSVVYGQLTSGRYTNSLTDSASHAIKVHFFIGATGTTPLTTDPDAYLLLATPTQINLVVPSTLPAAGSSAAYLTVDNSVASSDPVVLDVAVANPGFFTTTNGRNQAVAVLPDGSVNSSSNTAVLGTSSYITLYLAGMGAPTSTGAIATSGPVTTCVGLSNYVTAALAANSSWTTVDGSTIDSTLFPFNLPPCFDTTGSFSVTIGGVDFTSHASYAGWVSGSIAGLYQMNITLPTGSISGATKVPTSAAPAGTNGGSPYYIVATVGGVSSPASTVYVYLK